MPLDRFGNREDVRDHKGRLLERWSDVGDQLSDDAVLEDMHRFRRFVIYASVTSSRHGFIAYLPGRYPFFPLGLLLAIGWGAFALDRLLVARDGGGTWLAIGVALVGVSMMVLRWWQRWLEQFLASERELDLRVGFRNHVRIPMSAIVGTSEGSTTGSDRDGEQITEYFGAIHYLDAEGGFHSVSFRHDPYSSQPIRYIQTLRPDIRHTPAVPGSHPKDGWFVVVVVIFIVIATLMAAAFSIPSLIGRL